MDDHHENAAKGAHEIGTCMLTPTITFVLSIAFNEPGRVLGMRKLADQFIARRAAAGAEPA